MTQLQKARTLRSAISQRYWDLEYIRLLTELSICAGLEERLAAFVLNRFLLRRRAQPQEQER